MQEFLNYIRNDYFLGIICFIISLIAFRLSLKNYNPTLKPLRLYLGIYALGFAINCLYATFRKSDFTQNIPPNAILIYDLVFTVFEFAIFTKVLSYGLDHLQKSNLLRLVALTFTISMIALTGIGTILLWKKFSLVVQGSYIVQSLCLLAIVAAYFSNILEKQRDFDVSLEPTFWIAAGICFLIICTLPVTIIIMFVNKSNFSLMESLYSIINVFYSSMFILFIRAFSCKTIKQS